MPIIVNLDVMLARRKMRQTGRARAIRFTTLDAICEALDCQPGDILEYVPDNEVSG
jgi:putative transcriptional regulator